MIVLRYARVPTNDLYASPFGIRDENTAVTYALRWRGQYRTIERVLGTRGSMFTWIHWWLRPASPDEIIAVAAKGTNRRFPHEWSAYEQIITWSLPPLVARRIGVWLVLDRARSIPFS